MFNINDNKEKWLGGETTYTIENGKLTIKGKWFIGFLLDSLKKNTDYYVSYAVKVIKGTNARVRIYDLDKNFICTIINNNPFNSKNNTACWILFYTGDTVEETNEIEYTDIMVKEKYPINEYEPYVEPNEVTFNLNDEKLRSVGTVKDELVVDLDTGDYFKVENIGEIIFDGSDDEGWEKYASVRDTKLFDYSFNIMGNIENIEFINFNYVQNGMCNMSKMGLYSARTIHECEKEGIEFGATRFYFAYEKFSNYTIEEFKEWLNSNNIVGNYILKKPTAKKLGTLSSEDLAKLKTFKGYNNVTVNTNLGLMNIRFTYGLDIKKYVDNKIAQLSEQLIKGE